MENIKPLGAEGLAVLWTQILLQFVKKEEGKGLSTNDLTNELLQKIQSAGTSNFDGYYNSLIGQPQINGITLTGNKTLEDLGITQAITDAIGNVTQISFEVIPSFTDLPIIGEVGTFYLTPNNGSGNNNYDEWIWNEKNSMYELIGSIQSDIELSNYYTKTEVDNLINGIQSSQIDCVPTGTIIAFMGKKSPNNYLSCDGTVYNISDYEELAHFFGNQFGSANFFGGDGVNTFAVPDLRAEFLRGTGTATRDTGSGADVGIHQQATEIVHLGLDTTYDQLYFLNIPDNVPGQAYYGDQFDKFYTASKYGKQVSGFRNAAVKFSEIFIDGSSPQHGLFTTRPTNTSVMFCIKCKETFRSERKDVLLDSDTLKIFIVNNKLTILFNGWNAKNAINEFTFGLDGKHYPYITEVQDIVFENKVQPGYIHDGRINHVGDGVFKFYYKTQDSNTNSVVVRPFDINIDAIIWGAYTGYI